MKIIKNNKNLYNALLFFSISLVILLLSSISTEVNARVTEYAYGNGDSVYKPPSVVPVNVSTAVSASHNDGSSTISMTGSSVAFKNESDVTNLFNVLFDKANFIISGISGIVALTLVLLVIKQFTELGYHAGNPQERAKVLNGLLWTFIAIGISGSVSLFMGLFYNLI